MNLKSLFHWIDLKTLMLRIRSKKKKTISTFRGSSTLISQITIVFVKLSMKFIRLNLICICCIGELQGIEVYVRVSIQDVVDDAEDGHLRQGHPIRDAIFDRGGTRRLVFWGRERRRGIRSVYCVFAHSGGRFQGCSSGECQQRVGDLSWEWYANAIHFQISSINTPCAY